MKAVLRSVRRMIIKTIKRRCTGGLSLKNRPPLQLRTDLINYFKNEVICETHDIQLEPLAETEQQMVDILITFLDLNPAESLLATPNVKGCTFKRSLKMKEKAQKHPKPEGTIEGSACTFLSFNKHIMDGI